MEASEIQKATLVASCPRASVREVESLLDTLWTQAGVD